MRICCAWKRKSRKEEAQALEPICRAVSENPQRSPEEILELLQGYEKKFAELQTI